MVIRLCVFLAIWAQTEKSVQFAGEEEETHAQKQNVAQFKRFHPAANVTRSNQRFNDDNDSLDCCANKYAWA